MNNNFYYNNNYYYLHTHTPRVYMYMLYTTTYIPKATNAPWLLPAPAMAAAHCDRRRCRGLSLQ